MKFDNLSTASEKFLNNALKSMSKVEVSNRTALSAAGVGAAAAVFYWAKNVDLISYICDRTYIYNICWEDPAVDREILKITEDDVIFRICSAGDTVLDYAIEGPQKIIVCDMNQHQLYLFELKVHMLRDPALTYEEWWSIWGDSDADVAVKVWKRMRHTVSTDARQWWDGRIESTFRNGFAQSGSSGFIVKCFLPYLLWWVGFDSKRWAETGFSHSYIKENAHFLTGAAKWFRRWFPKVLAPFAGVPENQIGPEFETVEFYEDILREIFLDPDFGQHNYFYRFYFEGGYKCQRCCPRFLQREFFEKLCANASCFEWHHATVQQTMERVKPHTFTKLILLDHMDWMPNNIVHDEWIALQRATAPGATVLWRSAFTTMDDKPFFNNVDVVDLSPSWYKMDRVKMYPGTFMAQMPHDQLPFVDPVPSPCQLASTARKFQTAAKMILHPLTSGGESAHGDKMSSFYASQAQGYDAVRENMLVARPDMMSAFGPIMEGHTWLDVGGGTGRNLHFLRAQLSMFSRIVVLDICPELLAMGEINARKSFTEEQCERISWVCLDINSPTVKKDLSKYLGDDITRGFDTITFSYSLSMIPKWEDALRSAKELISPFGRVLVSDFDTYSEQGNTIKDFLIRTWYKQDGVRIDASSRHTISSIFEADDMRISFARFQRKLWNINIPHYVACCRFKTETFESNGMRRSNSSLVQLDKLVNIKGTIDYGDRKSVV